MAILIVLLLTFALRIFNLEHLPPFVHWDEVNQAQQAFALVQGAEPLWGVGYNGNPNLTFFAHAPFLLFGGELWGLRFTSALWSVLAVVVAYFAVRQMLDARVALIAAALMASAHLLVHYGRTGVNVLPAIVSSFLALGLYCKAQRQQSLWLQLLAGAALALNLYTYVAARATLVAALALWLFALSSARQSRPAVLRAALVYAAGFLLVAAPILYWYALNPHDLYARAQTLSIFGEWGMRVNEVLYGQVDTPTLLLLQTLHSLGGFVVAWDTSPNYQINAPLLDPLSAVMVLPGIALAWRRQRALTAALLLSMLGGLVAGAILTIEPPSSPHYIVLAPLALVFAAVSFEALASAPAWRGAALLLLPLALVFNLFLYFDYYPAHGAPHSLATELGFLARERRDCCTLWYIGEPGETEQQITAFVAMRTPIQYVPDVDQLLMRIARGDAEGQTVVIVVPVEAGDEAMPLLREWLPGGYEQAHYTHERLTCFTYTRAAR